MFHQVDNRAAFTADYRQTLEDVKVNGLKPMPLRVYLDRHRRLPARMRSVFPFYYFQFSALAEHFQPSLERLFGNLSKRTAERLLTYAPQYHNSLMNVVTDDKTHIRLWAFYTGRLTQTHLDQLVQTFMNFASFDMESNEDHKFEVKPFGEMGHTSVELTIPAPWSQMNAKEKTQLIKLIYRLSVDMRMASAQWVDDAELVLTDTDFPRYMFSPYLLLAKDNYYSDEQTIMGGYSNLESAVEASKLLANGRYDSIFLIENESELVADAY